MACDGVRIDSLRSLIVATYFSGPQQTDKHHKSETVLLFWFLHDGNHQQNGEDGNCHD
jgi:hypothetical protein